MIIGLIPARLNSKRIPHKPIVDIGGLPLVIHVYKRALMSKLIDKVIICADDKKIVDVAKKYNCNVILTSKKFKNGTERIASIARKVNCKLVIDLQCDNLFLKGSQIDKLINFHIKNKNFDIIIPHALYKKKNDISAVKIIANNKNKILMMSRADIPSFYRSSRKPFLRHQDFISFKKKSLLKYIKLKPTKNEKYENIELLRALENNLNLGTFAVKAFKNVHSVNTKKDLKLARKYIKLCKINKKFDI